MILFGNTDIKILLNLNDKDLTLRLKSKRKVDYQLINSLNLADNVIVDFCINNNFDYFRGESKDVLDRYYHCAIKSNFSKNQVSFLEVS